MNEPRVASIHVGKVAPLGPDGVPSGFVKHGVSSAVNVVHLGIVGATGWRYWSNPVRISRLRDWWS